MWPHIINNSKFLSRRGSAIKGHLNLKWMIFNAWLILTECVFFFFYGYFGWIFCYLFGVFLTKKFASAWLLEILTLYFHFLLGKQFPTFFSCFLLSILETLCSHSHFRKQFFNLSIWPGDLPYEKNPFFGRKALRKLKPSSILKFQRSPAEVLSLNILRLVTLHYWPFEQPRSPWFSWGFLSLYSNFPSSRSTWNYPPISVSRCALTHVFLFLQGVKTLHFFLKISCRHLDFVPGFNSNSAGITRV